MKQPAHGYMLCSSCKAGILHARVLLKKKEASCEQARLMEETYDQYPCQWSHSTFIRPLLLSFFSGKHYERIVSALRHSAWAVPIWAEQDARCDVRWSDVILWWLTANLWQALILDVSLAMLSWIESCRIQQEPNIEPTELVAQEIQSGKSHNQTVGVKNDQAQKAIYFLTPSLATLSMWYSPTFLILPEGFRKGQRCHRQMV